MWKNGAVKRSLTVEIEVTSLLPKEVSRFIFESSSLILLFFSKRLGRLGRPCGAAARIARWGGRTVTSSASDQPRIY